METTISPKELDRLMASGTPFALLDVRRQPDFEADDVIVPGARHADPERVEDWSQTLDPEGPIVVYCVKGGSVSQSVSATLREQGLQVRYVEGGITAWKAHGGIGAAKDSA